MRTTFLFLGITASFAAAQFLGCTGSDDSDLFGTSSTGGGSSGQGGNTMDGGGDGTGGKLDGGGGNDANPPDARSESDRPDSDACTVTSVQARRTPVDLLLMLDRSGSMTATLAGSAQTKWQAIMDAMSQFASQPDPEGVAVGLQYFPVHVQQLDTCFAPGYACALPGDFTCVLSTDASPYGYCLPVCYTPSECGDGECMSVSTIDSVCTNDSCNVDSYRTPALEFGPLATTADALVQSIRAQEPFGTTPTRPALEGAIAHATDRAIQHPDHEVVVVLATDGVPTVCPVIESDEDIAELVRLVGQTAEQGVAGNPSIHTYVIGILGSDDVSDAHLQSIAKGGGTDRAFIVNPAQGAAEQFAAALAEIREQVAPCAYQIPPPEEGELDYDKVNVEYTSEGGAEQAVYFVDAANACDPTTGGWYYDIDPDSGTPQRIIACPATCEQFKSGGSIAVAVGCETETAPR